MATLLEYYVLLIVWDEERAAMTELKASTMANNVNFMYWLLTTTENTVCFL